MAISTYTILDSMEFAKRFNFNRPSGIGNRLEPARTSANLVMQTILSPPFSWRWNTEELTFTCNSTAPSVGLTGNVSVTGGIITVNAVLPLLGVGQLALLTGFTVTAAKVLNNLLVSILTNTGTAITGAVSTPDLVSTSAAGGNIAGATTQDYSLFVPEMGHIEHSNVLDISNAASPKWVELATKDLLALDSNPARPQFINLHTQDASGNLVFRLMPAPNKNYPISIHIQKSAPNITSLNQTWAPLPDYMQYIYDQGFLSAMYAFSDDPRRGEASQKFATHLIGRASGLTAIERNIFLNSWNDLTQLEIATMNQGVQARGNG